MQRGKKRRKLEGRVRIEIEDGEREEEETPNHCSKLKLFVLIGGVCKCSVFFRSGPGPHGGLHCGLHHPVFLESGGRRLVGHHHNHLDHTRLRQLGGQGKMRT